MRRITVFSQATLLGLLGFVSFAQASGFALIEQSASGQGLSYAGAAASTEDASVMWFNAAGITKIRGSQAILGAHVIVPKSKFTNAGSTGVVAPSTGGLLSGADDDGATLGTVPNLYWAGEFGKYHVGFGLNVPFGQHVSYDESWVGRYHATETDLKSYNFNPTIARHFNNIWSIGLGLNAQYIDVVLGQKINQAAIGQPDASAKVTGNSWAYGYNLGLLFTPTHRLSLGLSYRSGMTHDVKGQVSYQGVNSTVSLPSLGGAKLNQVLFDAGASAQVNLPANASLALDYQLNPDFSFLASTTWTGWKAYDELVIDFDNKAPNSESNQNFKDSMRYAVGLIYQMTPNWKLRSGFAIDQSPVPNEFSRSPRTPDADRQWISIGLGYRMTRKISVDLAYSHLSADRSKVDYTAYSSLGNSVLKGTYDTAVDIGSVQLVWQY